jgi:hypothetical protein
MVVVEICAPIYDEESNQIESRMRALVKAEGEDLEITGDANVLGDQLFAVVDIQTGKQLTSNDDPEAWARNLPYAYRSGDLVARVVIDTDGPKTPTVPASGAPSRRDLPTIPAPPAIDRAPTIQSR